MNLFVLLKMVPDTVEELNVSADGKALDGEYGRQNFRLKPVRIEEGVYWGVIRFWMPEVKVVEK